MMSEYITFTKIFEWFVSDSDLPGRRLRQSRSGRTFVSSYTLNVAIAVVNNIKSVSLS